MRATLLAAAILLGPSAITVAATREPQVLAPISAQDVREITRTLRAITPKPITIIGSVYNPKWPHHTRSDIVSVIMGPSSELTGDGYTLEKRDGRWQIIGKGTWIH